MEAAVISHAMAAVFCKLDEPIGEGKQCQNKGDDAAPMKVSANVAAGRSGEAGS